MKKWATRLIFEEEGQGMVEYALIILLIAVALILSLTGFGTTLRAKYLELAGDINSF